MKKCQIPNKIYNTDCIPKIMMRHFKTYLSHAIVNLQIDKKNLFIKIVLSLYVLAYLIWWGF